LGMPPGPITSAGIRAYALAMHCGVSSKAELEAIAARFPATKAASSAKGKGPRGAKSRKGAKRAKSRKRAKRATPEAARVSLGQQLAEDQLGGESSLGAPTEARAKAAMLRSLQQRWVSQQDESDGAQRPSALRSSSVQPPRTVAEIALIRSAAPE